MATESSVTEAILTFQMGEKKSKIQMGEQMKPQVSKYQRALKAPLSCIHFTKKPTKHYN